MAASAQPSKYCLGCQYCLDHLESAACPECGQEFNPGNPETYATTPKRSDSGSARRLSLIYLIWGSLAVIGFLAFFNRWPAPFMALFCLAIPFYIAALTFMLLVHPALCLIVTIHHAVQKKPFKVSLLHLIWSVAIAAIFYTLILNGYIITA